MPIDRLPPCMRRPAENLRRFLMTDATVLMILGVGCIARGVSYSSHLGPVPHQHPAEAWMGIGAWSTVWILVGVACVIITPWHRSVTAALAVGAGMSLHLLWGFSFLWNTLHGDSPRGWVSSIGYFMVALLVAWTVWRGSRIDVILHDARKADDD